MLAPRSWVRQKPPPGARINQSHGLAQRLAGFWFFGEGGGRIPFDALTGRYASASLAGTLSYVDTPFGSSPKWDGTVNSFFNVGSDSFYHQPGSLPITIVALVMPASLAALNGIFCTSRNTTTYFGASLNLNTTTGAVASQFGDGSGGGSTARRTKTGATALTTNTYYTVGTSIQSSSNMPVYLNGLDDAGTTSGTGGAYAIQAASPAAIAATNAATSSMNGVIVYVALWRRMLTAAEHMQMHEAPFDMFTRRAPRFRHVPVETTDSATLATTVTLDAVEGPGTEITDVGTLATVASLSSLEIIEDVDAAVLTVTAQLDALTSAQFSESATIVEATSLAYTEQSERYDTANLYTDVTVSSADHICTVTPQLSGVAYRKWAGADQYKWLGAQSSERWSATLIEGPINNPC